MENSKKWNLPLHHGIKFSKDLCSKTDKELDKISLVPYASAIGSIMFLDYGGEKELRVTSYCDASWQTDKDDSHSQSGWVFLLNGGAVTWKSSKQDTVADSTCESEYIAACEALKEAIWMKKFHWRFSGFTLRYENKEYVLDEQIPTINDDSTQEEIEAHQKHYDDANKVSCIMASSMSPELQMTFENTWAYEMNQQLKEMFQAKSAIALTKEPKDHGKSKHIERKYHFVRSKVEEGHMIVKDIRSEDNLADPFTKMSFENGVNPPTPNPLHNLSFSLLSVLGRGRLTGPNYMDWMRNLRFILRYENKEYVLDEQIPTINDDSTQEEIEAHQKHYDDANKVSCIMASSMSPELQMTIENTWAYEMNQQLKEIEEELRVTSYCDASWKTDNDSRSQSGWVFLLNGGAVTWKSSKQDTVADSTCESEYIAACERC
ncbi:hypothetical protein Tco_0273560 [Tanacetum coccineum]